MSNMLANKSQYLAAALVLPVMALLVVGGSTLVLARPQSPHQGSLHGGAMMERIFDQLELTPTQQEQIEAILDESHEQLEPQWQAVKAARESLFEKIHAEVFNEGAIRQAAAEVAAVEEDLAVSRGLVFQEVLQILFVYLFSNCPVHFNPLIDL